MFGPLFDLRQRLGHRLDRTGEAERTLEQRLGIAKSGDDLLRVLNTEDLQSAAQPFGVTLDARLTGKQVLGDHSRFRRPSTLEVSVSKMPLRGGNPVVE